MMFESQFYVDQRPSNLIKQPSIYVFSRPFNLRSVKPCDTRKIFTTALLKSSMLCSEVIRNSIEVINDDGLPSNIELSNGELVCIRAFSWGSKTLNVIFLFENKCKFTLYAGRFISTGEIVGQNILIGLMREKKINDLYIDTTAYNFTEANMKRTACREIKELIHKNSGYKFHLLIDSFGYEDLIFELAKCGLKIFLDKLTTGIFKCQQCLDYFSTNPQQADIVLINKLLGDAEKQYHEDNIIMIKLTTETGAESLNHLRIVKYTFFPTQVDIFQITYLAAPLAIRTINATGTIPDELAQLCRY